jgi:hypothetical protein
MYTGDLIETPEDLPNAFPVRQRSEAIAFAQEQANATFTTQLVYQDGGYLYVESNNGANLEALVAQGADLEEVYCEYQ